MRFVTCRPARGSRPGMIDPAGGIVDLPRALEAAKETGALIESLPEGLTIEPGDLLATGTPSGGGYAMDPPNFLTDGDVITCQIDGMGELTNAMRNISAIADVS